MQSFEGLIFVSAFYKEFMDVIDLRDGLEATSIAVQEDGARSPLKRSKMYV